jgi:hypothetical protein
MIELIWTVLNGGASAIGYFVLGVAWILSCLLLRTFLYEYSQVTEALKPYPQWCRGLNMKQRISVKANLVFTGAERIAIELEDGSTIRLEINRSRSK